MTSEETRFSFGCSAVGLISKQGQHQPHFYSKARHLTTQLIMASKIHPYASFLVSLFTGVLALQDSERQSFVLPVNELM